MELVFLHKKLDISKYKNRDILNLCIHATFQKHFSINPELYFNLIEPSKSQNFKEKYLRKIDEIGFSHLNLASNSKIASQILSYRTFSKLSVSDNLVDKFWVLEQLELFETSNIIIFIDDYDIYNLFRKSSKIKINPLDYIPYKQFFYFLIFLFKKIKGFNQNKSVIFYNDYKLFVGNKFESNRNSDSIYNEYFFSKYWKNQENSYLLLNRGDFNSKLKISCDILFKESFLTFKNLFNLLFISIKHFYYPIQISVKSIDDILINKNLIIDVKSGSFIDAFQNFYIYNNILNSIKNKKGTLVIPHEGRLYERIICKLFSETEIKVIGYAHFPVSQRILNYHYGKFENLIYKNFTFYTLSINNFNQFELTYKWPINKIKIGPHLKFKNIKHQGFSNKENDILVLLGNELVQNIKLLKFIEFCIKDSNLKVAVRLHPSTRGIKNLKKLFPRFIVPSNTNTSLIEDLASSKIIVYGDTGAAIDCLNFNNPLCYINDDNCLISDRINDSIKGHFRFYKTTEFIDALPGLFSGSLNISYDMIKNNYISSLNPETFNFE